MSYVEFPVLCVLRKLHLGKYFDRANVTLMREAILRMGVVGFVS
jgi:hypothetical protein